MTFGVGQNAGSATIKNSYGENIFVVANPTTDSISIQRTIITKDYIVILARKTIEDSWVINETHTINLVIIKAQKL